MIDELKYNQSLYSDLGAQVNIIVEDSFSNCPAQAIFIRMRSDQMQSSVSVQVSDIKEIFGEDAVDHLAMVDRENFLSTIGMFLVDWQSNGNVVRYVFVGKIPIMSPVKQQEYFRGVVAEELFQAVMLVGDQQITTRPDSISNEYLDPAFLEEARGSGHPSLHSYIYANLEAYIEHQLEFNPLNLCLIDAYAIAIRARKGDFKKHYEEMKKTLLPHVFDIYKDWARSGKITRPC